MIIDKYGKVVLTSKEVLQSIYNGKLKDFSDIFLDDEAVTTQFNQAIELNADSIPKAAFYQNLETDLTNFDKENQNNWFMPAEYKNMDIEAFLVSQCPKQNYERLVEELDLFRQHNMMELLRYLKYLVDTMRGNNIVWGVGRGSSVASYVLYLIGVHKIDSIKYKLDIKEFLK